MQDPSPPKAPSIVALAWRQSLRDFRTGELRLLALAVLLAVVALTAVGFFADRLNQGLVRDAAALLGGDAVTAVSRFLAEETQLVFGVRKEVEVVHNFVDVERFKPGGRKPWTERPDQERVLVHASNFRPVKRTADVVRAFARIEQELPAKLVLIGDGPDREHALAVASDLGVLGKVEHLGMQENVQDLLPQADLFLSASETESFGLSMLEAMSCGVPCVSTDVGGVSEVLGDTGRLVPFADPDAMAAAALPLLRDADLHRRLAETARQRAVEHFATERIVEQYERIYRRVLG